MILRNDMIFSLLERPKEFCCPQSSVFSLKKMTRCVQFDNDDAMYTYY